MKTLVALLICIVLANLALAQELTPEVTQAVESITVITTNEVTTLEVLFSTGNILISLFHWVEQIVELLARQLVQRLHRLAQSAPAEIVATLASCDDAIQCGLQIVDVILQAGFAIPTIHGVERRLFAIH